MFSMLAALFSGKQKYHRVWTSISTTSSYYLPEMIKARSWLTVRVNVTATKYGAKQTHTVKTRQWIVAQEMTSAALQRPSSFVPCHLAQAFTLEPHNVEKKWSQAKGKAASPAALQVKGRQCTVTSHVACC